MMVFGVSLFSYRLWETPITLSDVFLLSWILCCVLALNKLEVNRVGILAVCWLTAALISGLLLSLSPYSQLNGGEYLGSLARGIVCTSILFTAAPVVRWLGITMVGLSIKRTIRIHSLILIIQALGIFLFGFNILKYISIPFWDLTRIIVPIYSGISTYELVSGLFAEPAFFGWCMCLYIFTLISFYDYNKSKECHIQYIDFMLVGVAAGLSQSFISVGLVGLALVAHLWANRGDSINPIRLFSAAIPIGLMIIGSISFGGTLVKRNIVERMSNILSLTDYSLRDRIFGSLEAMMTLISNAPITGVGLGNIAASVERISSELMYKAPGNFDLHIAWVSAMVSTGLVGAMFYLLMLVAFAANRRTYWAGIGFLIASLAFGGFLNGCLWWFIGVGTVLLNPMEKKSL